MYLNCPGCGLSFRIQAMNLVVENCPRCLARSGRVRRLLLSDEPHMHSHVPLVPGADELARAEELATD